MDSVTAANAAIAASARAAAVNGAMCRDCNSVLVAWVTSTRTGKRYLADALIATAGKVTPLPHRPHFKTCKGRHA
jgi:hypothetical protein